MGVFDGPSAHDTQEPGPGAARPRLRKRMLAIARIGLTGVAIAWVGSRVPIASWEQALAALPRWAWLVPSAAMAINTLLLAERHRLALLAVGHAVPRGGLVLLHLRSAFAALALPRGGADLTRIAVLARQTGDPEAVLAAALHLRVVDLALWVGFLGAFLTQGPWPGLGGLELAAAVVSAGGVVVGLGLPLAVWLAGPAVSRVPRIGPRLVRMVEALRSAARAWKISLQLLALGLPMAVVNILSVTLLFQAGGAAAWSVRDALIVPAMDAVLALPVTIGGVGLREAVFLEVGAVLGLPGPVALAIAWTRWSGELSRALVGGLSLVMPGGWGERRGEHT